MIQLYQKNPIPLFKRIARWYGNGVWTAADAAKIITELPIFIPNCYKKEQAEILILDWNKYSIPMRAGKYRFSVELPDDKVTQLSKILDEYSRIMMGQLHILFEALDVPANLEENPHMLQMYHDVYWDGAYGAKKARDLLFPDIKVFGWHGGYGISNQRVAEDSRLAYQISRTMRGEYALPVTEEPLVQIKR